MQCSNGHDNVEGQHFCGICGIPLVQVAVEQPPLDPSPAPAAVATLADSPPGEAADADAPAGKPRKKWLIVAALVVIAAVAAGAAFTRGSSDGGRHTIRGVFTLTGSVDDVSGDWSSCEGTGGYSDFGPGQNVSVVDADGTLIGSGMTQSVDRDLANQIAQSKVSTNELGLSGSTETARAKELVELLDSMAQLGVGCMVYFEVKVPLSQFYRIEVGRRGELDYSLEQLSKKDFFVALTLGDLDL